jgi:peptidoglycan/LPS O-acetylase OafA/YrhL
VENRFLDTSLPVAGYRAKALPPPLPARIPALDGLRGLAALLVVFHHCFIWPMLFAKGIVTPKSFQSAYRGDLLPFFLWYGYNGVELFFLLSGFCLLYQVFVRKDRPFRLKTYAYHRIRRIYPPYVAALFLAVCLAALGWSKINAHLSTASEPVSVHAVIAALTLTGSHYCLPFWSLLVEAQWYLIVPVLAILWKRSRWLMHAGIVCFIALAALLDKSQFLHLHALAVYLPLFWIGILLADIAAMDGGRARLFCQRGLSFSLMAVGVIAIYFYAPPPPVWKASPAHAYPVAIFYTGLLSLALFTKIGRRVFSSNWLVKAGAFSYSLYLIHALVVYVAIVLMVHYRITGKRELILCLTALPAFCIAAGYVFFLAVEQRVMHRASRLDKRGIVDTSAGIESAHGQRPPMSGHMIRA